MSTRTRLLASAVLGVVLAMISITSLAGARNWQFVVMVRVVPHCQLFLPPEDSHGGQYTIECTRNTGYSVSLAGNDARPGVCTAVISRVGNGTTQVIPLQLPAAVSANTGLPSTAPLFLTITY